MNTTAARRMIMISLALGCLWLFPQPAAAQVGGYRPSSPTISPYLFMFRRNDQGPLFRYYAFVKPRNDFRSYVNQQQRQLNQFRSNVEQQIRVGTGDQTSGIQVRQRTGVGEPATTGGYLNTLQFFPTPQGRRQR